METPLASSSYPGDMTWTEHDSPGSERSNQVGNSSISNCPSSWSDSGHHFSIGTDPMSSENDNVDNTVDSSSAPTMIHSASSTCTDTWSTDTGIRDGDDGEADIDWERGSDDILTLPKVEPADDFDMAKLEAAPLSPPATLVSPTTGSKLKTKRPRGRPRKQPCLTPAVSSNKVTKGRSKTGCITCRKRKKKCDEAKPRCKHTSCQVLT